MYKVGGMFVKVTVLRDDGTLWLNLGDSYASVHTGGHKSAKINSWIK